MCIFSGRVRSVSDTNIFARLSGRGTQFLVYSMKYSSDQPVAMILPLPVAAPEKRAGIRFISFKDYADFFNDLEHGFPRPPMPRSRAVAVGAGGLGSECVWFDGFEAAMRYAGRNARHDADVERIGWQFRGVREDTGRCGSGCGLPQDESAGRAAE